MRPRCLITGSQYGLGLAFKRQFEPHYDIVEYDLILGQNLSIPEVRDQVIEDLRTCQLFILNSSAYQLELLNRAYELQNDLTIVVSSDTLAFFPELPEDVKDNEDIKSYREDKRALTERCRQLQAEQTKGIGTRTWILTLMLSWLDTNTNQQRPEPKMKCEDVAELVHSILLRWPGIAVQEVVMSAPIPELIDRYDWS
jgi:hypothetical protein